MLGSPGLTIQRCKMMTSRPLLLLTLSAVLLAGCGSAAGAGVPASSSTDVNTLLSDTFRNVAKIGSANITAKLALDGKGQSAGATLSGPFESQGAGKLPKFQIDATFNSGAQSFTAGVTWTGDKGFVNVQGTQYELSRMVANQLQASYEQAAKQSRSKAGGSSAALLGIDFSKWLRNGRNAGAAQVGSTETIKITGEADVARVIDDLQRVAEKARTLNLPGTTQVPSKLTPEQRRQIVAAVKTFAIEVYTGKQDRILRRLVVAADLQDPASKAASHVSFDLTLDKVGDAQTIETPSNAKPFSELMKIAGQLKGLGSLGGLAGGATGGGASGSGSSAAPSSDTIAKYAKCVEKAQGDSAQAQKCAGLLGA
jgi:hypothetical protein